MWKKITDSFRINQVTRLNKMSTRLYEQGRYQESVAKATQAYELAHRYLSENHPALITSLNNMAKGHHHLGDYHKAEQFYQQALQSRRTIFGEAHPDVVESLHNLATLYETEGDYAQAELLLQQAQVIAATVMGEKHPDTAHILNALGSLYYEQGDLTRSEPFLLQALAIQRQGLRTMHPDLSVTLNNLGLLYETQGNYLQARRSYQEALEILHTEYGEQHPEVASVMTNLAEVCRLMADYAQAVTLHQRALQIIRATLGENHSSMASILNGLALTFQSVGDYDQAITSAQQALAISRAFYGEHHINVATGLSTLGMIYNAMGNYTQAEPLLQQALAMTRAITGKDHFLLANTLNNLGLLYEARGNTAQAELLLQQALDIRRKALGEMHPDVGRSMNTLALYYAEIKRDYTRAEELFQQALAVRRATLGETHPEVAQSLNSLAKLYRLKHDYVQARSFCQQALDIRRMHLGENHPDTAESLNNIAVLCYPMNDYSQSEQYFQQAIEIWRATLGENHSAVVAGLYNLASLYAATGRYGDAFALMEQGSAIEDQIMGQIFSLGSEQQRMVYVETLQQHFHTFLTLLVQHFSDNPEILRRGMDRVLRRKGIEFEALSAQRDAVLRGRYPDLTPKLRHLTLLRAQIARRTLAGPDSAGLEVHQALLREWNDQKERLEEELAHQIPEINLTRQQQTMNHQAVIKALPIKTALVEFVRFDAIDFQSIMNDNASWGEARYIAIILQSGVSHPIQLIDLGNADRIDQAILAFRSALTGEDERTVTSSSLSTENMPPQVVEPQGEKVSRVRHLATDRDRSHVPAYVSPGHKLRAMIFDPLLVPLGQCTQLLLAPDGDLTRLPFEVLPDDQDGHLIDTYRISYVSVSRDVVRFERSFAGSRRPPLVIADPNFDLDSQHAPLQAEKTQPLTRQSRDLKRDALHFTRLPGTQREGQQIAQMLNVQVCTGDAAVEAVLRTTQSPYILHIATHGFFLPDQIHCDKLYGTFDRQLDVPVESRLEQLLTHPPENPLLRSSLALAGVNTWNRGGALPAEAEDGLLTAEDVTGIDLLDTTLVVLSACETGLGHIRVGEGVFGLRRAFLLAGARTLVMSLWKVPDQQTQELMIDFYKRILQRQACAEALRDAQLAMKQALAHPRYWGAFICHGNPRAL